MDTMNYNYSLPTWPFWPSRRQALICLVLLASPLQAHDLRVKAVAGEPYGIGEISFPIEVEDGTAWHCRSIRLREASDRVLFPILEHPGMLVRLASKLDGELPDPPARATIRFFFLGDEPLQLSLTHLPGLSITYRPEVHRQARYHRMCRAWWNQIWGPLGDRLRDGARPRPVENYLAGLGMWRLGIKRSPSTPPTSMGTLDALLLGTSRQRAEMSRLVAFDGCCDQPADRPLPPAISWRTAQMIHQEDTEVEEIAHHVPESCFYLRFGKYTNLLWAMRVLEAQGEELQRLVTLRGYHGRVSEKIQNQLAIAELPFADLIGDTLIGDVALIGRDAYLTDGAALGIILRAKNGVLAKGLQSVRRDAVKQMRSAGANESKVTIEGTEVSLISTDDNRLRSFHVIDGDWHLITNSHAIATDFLRIGQGQVTLADSAAFQQIRQAMPPNPDHVLFAYLSTEFMKGVTTPEYLIELQRRLRAAAEAQVLQVALLAVQAHNRAALASGHPTIPVEGDGNLIATLKEAHFLPPGFACRSDSSRPILRDGTIIDSMRGGVGTFLPIADILVEGATPEEVRVYHRFATMHSNSWSSLDPLVASIERTKVVGKKGRERLIIDARVTPLQASNASILLGVFGQARRERIEPPEDALIVVEAIANGQLTTTGEDAQLQLSVLDQKDNVPAIYGTRLTDYVTIARQLKMRMLVQPREAGFDRVWWHPAGTPDNPYWYGPLDMIGRQLENYAAIAMDQRLLDDLPPTVCSQSQDDAAQLWLRIEELEGSSLADVVTAVAAVRAMRGSLSNSQRFHQWSQLLGTNEAEAMELVEGLVGLQPVCPLDGGYELVDSPRGSLWRSSAWDASSLRAADIEEYQPALLRWWRGIDVSFAVAADGLRINAEVDVEFDMGNKPPSGLPSFPFFGSGKK